MSVINTKVSASGTEVVRSKLMNLLGKGVGDIGYGQNVNVFQNLVGRELTPEAFPVYRQYLQIAKNHQIGDSTVIDDTTLPEVLSGDVVEGIKFDQYDSYSDQLFNNHLNFNNNSMTLYPNIFNVIRNYWWGPRETIYCDVDVLWGNEDKARYFFNSGGDIRLTPSQPNWSWLQKKVWGVNWWQTFIVSYRSGGYWWNIGLPLVGTTRFAAHTTTSNGSVGTPSTNVGFYELTDNFQVILNAKDYYNPYANIPGYSDIDDFYIYAMKVANGVRFRVSFTEENRDQKVDPSTRVDFSLFKATTYLTNPPIDTPQFITRKTL